MAYLSTYQGFLTAKLHHRLFNCYEIYARFYSEGTKYGVIFRSKAALMKANRIAQSYSQVKNGD